MEQYKRNFISFMASCDVLKFGSFKLDNGQVSPFLIDAREYSTGTQLSKLGKYYARAIHQNFGDNFDVLFGIDCKGLLTAAAAAVFYGELYGREIRFCSNIKCSNNLEEAESIIKRKIKEGDRVIIISNELFPMENIEETLNIIKKQPAASITGEIIPLDCMIKSVAVKKNLELVYEKYGFPAKAIVSMDEVIEVLYTNGDKTVITESIKQDIDKYYSEYKTQY